MKLLLISDLHVGSYWGLMPNKVDVRNPLSGDITRITSSRGQRELYREWALLCERCKVEHIDHVIINGDIVEGQQYKNRGREVWTTDLSVQGDIARQLIEMLPCHHVYLTQGTEYHVQGDRPLEQEVADTLCEHGRDAHYNPDMVLEVGGARVHAMHKVGVTRTRYRATGISAEMMIATFNQDPKHEFGRIDVLVRSHAHYFAAAMIGHMTGIITPCWKMRDPFSIKMGSMSVPDNGYVLLDINDGNVTLGKKLFKCGKPTVTYTGGDEA